MAKVLYNGYNIGQGQGYIDLPVIGYAATWKTSSVVKDGTTVHISMSGFQPGTDCSGSFGFELPALIQPANQTRTSPISCNGTFYNAGSVLYGNSVHGEYESTFGYMYLKNFDINTNQDLGWTGSVGWYGSIDISYNMTSGI